MVVLPALFDLAAARLAGAFGGIVCSVAVQAAGAALGIFVDAIPIIEAAVGACRFEAMPVVAVLVSFIALDAAVAAVLGIRCKTRFSQAIDICLAAILIAGIARILAVARAAPLRIRMCGRVCLAFVVAIAAVRRIVRVDVDALRLSFDRAKRLAFFRARCLDACAIHACLAVWTADIARACTVCAAIGVARKRIGTRHDFVWAHAADGAGVTVVLALSV